MQPLHRDEIQQRQPRQSGLQVTHQVRKPTLRVRDSMTWNVSANRPGYQPGRLHQWLVMRLAIGVAAPYQTSEGLSVGVRSRS
jgi:hypothetical protein